jgi:hypothetical protein
VVEWEEKSGRKDEPERKPSSSKARKALRSSKNAMR